MNEKLLTLIVDVLAIVACVWFILVFKVGV